MPSIIIITHLVSCTACYVTFWLRNRSFPIEVTSISSLACLYFHYGDVLCVCVVRYSLEANVLNMWGLSYLLYCYIYVSIFISIRIRISYILCYGKNIYGVIVASWNVGRCNACCERRQFSCARITCYHYQRPTDYWASCRYRLFHRLASSLPPRLPERRVCNI
jgi:hypothetical protein